MILFLFEDPGLILTEISSHTPCIAFSYYKCKHCFNNHKFVV